MVECHALKGGTKVPSKRLRFEQPNCRACFFFETGDKKMMHELWMTFLPVKSDFVTLPGHLGLLLSLL